MRGDEQYNLPSFNQMNREIKYFIIALLVVGVAPVLLYFLSHLPKDSDSDTTFSKVPGRLIELGPYAKNINLTENVGAYSLNINAERLFVRKGKFLGFDTALQKKFVTNKLHLSLYKNGTKKLELYKDRVILNSFMRTIEIDSPKILYPTGMDQPKKVSLEKQKLMLTIHYKDKTDVWNLAK